MTLQHDYRGLYKIDQTIFFFLKWERKPTVYFSARRQKEMFLIILIVYKWHTIIINNSNNVEKYEGEMQNTILSPKILLRAIQVTSL